MNPHASRLAFAAVIALAAVTAACSRSASATCAKLASEVGVTECKDEPPTGGFSNASQASSFVCGPICHGWVYVFDTDARFDAATAVRADDMELMRASNPRTRTLVVLGGLNLKESDAAKIRSVVRP